MNAADLFPAAARLALELECLLLDTKDRPTQSRWWDSAHEALEQWRQVVRAVEECTSDAPETLRRLVP